MQAMTNLSTQYVFDLKGKNIWQIKKGPRVEALDYVKSID